MINQIAEEILTEPGFAEDLLALRQADASKFLTEKSVIGSESFTRLAQAASVMAASDIDLHRNVAYEVAAKLLNSNQFTAETRRAFLGYVLRRIENFPAERFFKELGAEGELPIAISAECEFARHQNTVQIHDSTFELSSYQRELWLALTSNSSVSTSAPTSAGKSFIVSKYVIEIAGSLEDEECIIYIVPSKALISQVSKSLRRDLGSVGHTNEVITVAPAIGDAPPKRAIFVFTQERLHTALKSGAIGRVRLLIVDESQEIGSDGRGVLLSSVIERVLRAFPRTQVLFAGPNIQNPGIFASIFGRNFKTISTQQRAVTQSLFFVDRTEDESSANLSVQNDGARLAVGTVKLPRPIRTKDDRLVSTACWLKGVGQTLVYVGGPASAERVSLGIAEDQEVKTNNELDELADLARISVHRNFSLATDVLKGVGYHYGRMPTVLREAVERAFEDGHLDYIVCTSTLLQGVNLPARNLIMHDPIKGDDEPIDGVEFWNLAGRAGRLGKEFEGNVFLVDYDGWASKPLDDEQLQNIESSYEEQIREGLEPLVEIFEDRHESTVFEENVFESTSARIFGDYLNGRLDAVLSRAGIAKNTDASVRYREALEKLAAENQIPLPVLNESPSVPVARQNNLYRRLKRSLKKGPDYVIPKHPMDTDAYKSHQLMYQRCYKEVLGAQKNFGKIANRTTALSLEWARGAPIPRLIDKAYGYAGKNPRWASVIRSTLADVENLLRFQCVKMTSCYTAVLRHLLEESGHEGEVTRIPSISAYLEVGAASSTMLSLMSLGMSRFSASQFQAAGAPQNLTRSEALTFLRDRSRQLDVSARCVEEADQLVEAHLGAPSLTPHSTA